MSTKLVLDELARFLGSKEPEVLCVTGRWGVGKTYAWNQAIRSAQACKGIALDKYAYVSLFGVTSLDQLRYAIFENTLPTEDIGITPSLETLQSNFLGVMRNLGKKSLGIVRQVPVVKSYIGEIPTSLLWTSDTIICIDDLERRSISLQLRDVLGLVSYLKDQRRCKVLLILNDEAFREEKDKEEFRLFLEKVIDARLVFSPSAAECAEISLKDRVGANDTHFSNCCVTLGISNIRVIKRIERMVVRLEDVLDGVDEGIIQDAVKSLTLLGWSLFDQQSAPPLDYLCAKQVMPTKSGGSASDSSTREKWDPLLAEYGFVSMDEMSSIMLEGLKRGYFDSSAIRTRAQYLDERLRSEKKGQSFSRSWDKFHDSFADNADEVAETIYGAARDAIAQIDLMNLNSTIDLLKELGHIDSALDLVSRYVEAHRGEKAPFDLDSYVFRNRITDPDLASTLRETYRQLQRIETPSDILARLTGDSWSREDATKMAALSTEEYRDLFMSTSGDVLRKGISWCLQFERVRNADDTMKAIASKARAALCAIGKESRINNLRVRVYGIEVPYGEDMDDTPDPPAATPAT